MELTIIIINYNSHRLLLNCLESIYRETKNISFEIIIVDNASAESGRDIVLTAYPNVKWIQMTYNAGFARANNEGIRNSKASAILLLNPDTLIQENAIENAFKKLSASDAVACGVQLLNADGTPQISGNYFTPGGLNYLLPLPYLGNLLKKMGNVFNVGKPHVPDAKGTVEVHWINGAFLMVKRLPIEKAGLMDEDFFLYAEEAEWCSRLIRVGKLVVYGDLHVVHLQGETATKAFESSAKEYNNLYDKKGLQIIVSNLLRIRKQFGVGWLLLIFFFYLFDIIIFPVCLFFEKIFKGDSSQYAWWQVNGFSSNVVKTMRLLPKMIDNRPYFYKVL